MSVLNPPNAYQVARGVNFPPNTNWSTSETTLMTITVDRTGYWWASGSVALAPGGGGSNITERLRMAGAQIDAKTWNNPPGNGNGGGLVSTSAPVLLTAGQTITLTVQNDGGTQQYANDARTNLTAGFVPAPGYAR